MWEKEWTLLFAGPFSFEGNQGKLEYEKSSISSTLKGLIPSRQQREPDDCSCQARVDIADPRSLELPR